MESSHALPLKAFNSLFKRFYFTRTQRGGATNQGLGKRSRLEPMARWLQRRLVFMCGYDYEEIVQSLRTVEDDEIAEWSNWVRDCGGDVEYCKFVSDEAKQRAMQQPSWTERDTTDLMELDKWVFEDPLQWYDDDEDFEVVHGPVLDDNGKAVCPVNCEAEVMDTEAKEQASNQTIDSKEVSKVDPEHNDAGNCNKEDSTKRE